MCHDTHQGNPPWVFIWCTGRPPPSLLSLPVYSVSHLLTYVSISPKEQMCPSLHKNKLAIHHLVLVSHFSSLPIMKATESRSCHVLFCFFKDYPCDFQWSFFFLKIWWLWVFENHCLLFPWICLLGIQDLEGGDFFISVPQYKTPTNVFIIIPP